MRAHPPGASRFRRNAPTLVALVALAAAAIAADSPSLAAASEPFAAELARLRRNVPCDGAPTEEVSQPLSHRGRTATGITGRERGEAVPGPIRDFSVFTGGAGRIVSYICFPNASTRRSGEPIISLAEVSTIADARAQALLPGASLALESIQRYRTSEQESVYYEARYAPVDGDPPFLEPPIRLLLNASNGALFRLDVDPDWIDPAPRPRLQISGKAAERIAAVVLRETDLAPVFGAGAAVGRVGPAEMFVVRANSALAPAGSAAPDGRAQPAWVVPFRLVGGAAGTHAVFVDAATGRILGGAVAPAAGAPGAEPPESRPTR